MMSQQRVSWSVGHGMSGCMDDEWMHGGDRVGTEQNEAHRIVRHVCIVVVVNIV